MLNLERFTLFEPQQVIYWITYMTLCNITAQVHYAVTIFVSVSQDHKSDRKNFCREIKILLDIYRQLPLTCYCTL